MPIKRSLFWQTVPLQIVLVLVLLLFATTDGTRRFRRLALDHLTAELESDARLAAALCADALRTNDGRKADTLCKTFGRSKSRRFTVIRYDGAVLGDSEADPASMENHAGRPEIREALSGHPGLSERYSMTLDKQMMYVAVPVAVGGKVIGAARVSESLNDAKAFVRAAHFRLGLLPWAVGLFLALLSLGYGIRLKQSVKLLRGALSCIERDEFLRLPCEVPMPVLDPLAQELNRTAAAVRKRTAGVLQERDDLASVLFSMTEGVLVLNSKDRILRCNRAAGKMLHLSPDAVRGRLVQEVVRNSELLRFIEKIRSVGNPVEEDIVLYEEEDVFIQMHGTSLNDSEGNALGALLVFNDVTRLRRLENLRRDFTANVSHELKTPVTSIHGYAETLKDGAIRDPKEAGRFLDVILKHTNRLSAMIDDILNLSRIERQAEKGEIAFEEIPLKDILAEAAASYRQKTEDRKMTVQIECDESLKARLNSELMVQAVGNLIDNALKFSESGGKIAVRGFRRNGDLVVQVQDWGIGISGEHQSRLFERFYRVDPSRSRTLGGTGLGLAIVKHVAHAHGGRAVVESEEWKGSTFSIILPLEKE
jgi:two-component system phosphate regulon sensor histidine kinase PhoR